MSNIVDDVFDYPCYTYSMRMWADHREPCGSNPEGPSFCPESEVQRAKETKTPLLLPQLSKPHGRAVL